MNTRSIRNVNMLYLVSMLLVLTLGAYLQSLSFSWGLLATEVFLILAPALVFLRLDRAAEHPRLMFRRIPAPAALACFVGGVGMWFFDSLIETLVASLAGYTPPAGQAMLPNAPIEGLLVFLGLAVAAPVCEEILFRGVIQARYMQALRPLLAVSIPALMFAFFHLRLVGLVSLLPIAFFISFIYWRTGSLTGAMLAHFGNNLVSALVLLSAGFAVGTPGKLITLPNAAIGLAAALLSLAVIARLVRPPQAPPFVASPLGLRAAWPLFLAGLLYLGAAGFEVVQGLTGSPPPFAEHPWTQATELQYEVRHKGGVTVGSAACTLSPQVAGARLHCRRDTEPFEVRIGSSFYSGADVTLLLDAEWDDQMNLVLLQAVEQFTEGSQRWSVEAEGEELVITVSAYGQESERLAFGPTAFVEEEWPWRLSALDFQPGLYHARLVQPLMWREQTKSSGPLARDFRFVLTGRETVQTPAGEFTAWRLAGYNGENAWYAVNPPHTLVKYEGRMFDYYLVEAR